ncbi:iron chelate uptake ABC transporter family permease subunit [Arthrobacter sp. 35W]|uniref:iron chelate uptake ABC transporter family permease subunit n=1 Tax=Arthrobacter sp. 35W TaxID=1132441 RepID=UPI001E50FC39|nr:iron chelate uptake ABC transporter family permease subunit [Arthrobacter sp. 35W]
MPHALSPASVPATGHPPQPAAHSAAPDAPPAPSGPPAPPAPRTPRRRTLLAFLLLAAVLVLAGAVVLSLGVGAKFIPFSTVLEAFTHRQDTSDQAIIVANRLPRTLLGVVAGMALGAAGSLIQAVTRNPLADPGILGVNAGAAFAIVIAIGVFGVGSLPGYIWFAFAGAILTTAAVYLIGTSGRGGINPLRLTLSGVALGAVLTGIGSALMLVNPKAFDQMRAWNIGSLDGRTMDVVLTVLPFIAVGLLIAAACSRGLNAVALGDDVATSLGTSVAATRIWAVVAITLLAGGATAAVGAIGFVGLMVPHAARWITGPDQRWIMAFSVVLAPILLLVSDVLGRIAVPGELQVGIVTAFLGAPVLVALARRRKVAQL